MRRLAVAGALALCAGVAPGAQAQREVGEHLLDPHPTEIHVFASHDLPVTLMVATTENRLMWSIRRGALGHLGSIDQAGRGRD